ncbi:MAG: hypothetical protein HZA50_11195 [Planctomycetes bacterium]|nr:hypothetical protein [Planctomycetota bacterium]
MDALKRSNGNVTKAARDLGTTQRILGYKAMRLGLDFRRFRTTRQTRQDMNQE